MDEANQGDNPDASGNVPAKRKRGRPRKYPKLDLEHGETANASRDHGENSRVPPGLGGMNGNQPCQVDAINDANDAMVGQSVHGVIEAAFDAGYLLTVRVGSSDTTLRGVVFKPGHYVPVSADNDVAPDVRMIRRNNVPIPAEDYTSVHGHNSRSRARNDQQVNSQRNRATHPFNELAAANQVPRGATQSTNPLGSKGRAVASSAGQTAHPGVPRGHVVPVVLQPANKSNGAPISNQASSNATQVAHMEATKSKQVLDNPSNGSTPTNQFPAVGNQTLSSQSQNNHQAMTKGAQIETGTFNQPPPEVLHEVEAQSMRLPGMPFEKLLTEVMKRIQSPSKAAEIQIENTNLDAKSSANEMDQPLSIEPLQAVQPNILNHSTPMSKPFQNHRTGKMTELLQVVQENMMENQAHPADKLATGSRPNLEDPTSPDSDDGDEEGTP